MSASAYEQGLGRNTTIRVPLTPLNFLGRTADVSSTGIMHRACACAMASGRGRGKP